MSYVSMERNHQTQTMGPIKRREPEKCGKQALGYGLVFKKRFQRPYRTEESLTSGRSRFPSTWACLPQVGIG